MVTFFLTMVSEVQDPTIILSDIFNIVPSVQAQKLIDTVMVFSTLVSEVQDKVYCHSDGVSNIGI